jgi:D-beta-D-heptose 7-phosphate kinase/D-beta-D-heptose 1-phosphate adenosyltransferase
VGKRLLELLDCSAALVTRGEHGMSLFERGRPALHIPTAAREVFDVTGAGDTVIATLGLALGAGAALPDAARLANYAAGVVVGKLGTATATPQELLAAVEAGKGS